MNKYILGLTAAAAIICSPIVLADDDGDDKAMQQTSSQKGNTVEEVATPGQKQATIQLKTQDGKVIHATVPQKDIKDLEKGDKLEYLSLF